MIVFPLKSDQGIVEGNDQTIETFFLVISCCSISRGVASEIKQLKNF